MLGHFSDESLYKFQDFTRCVRPNGSAYGTRGKCKKGVEGQISELEENLSSLQKKIQSAKSKIDKAHDSYRAAKFKNKGKVANASSEAAVRRLNRYETELAKLREQERRIKREIESLQEPLKGDTRETVSKPNKFNRLTKLLNKINNRAKKILEEHGQKSPEFEKFRAKYGPVSNRVNEKLQELSPFN